MHYINVYTLLINALAFQIMRFDKQAARKRKRRIPEKILFSFAFAGGSTGIYLAMWIFRHKTNHKTFTLLVPLLTVLQILGYFALRSYLNG